MVKSNYITEHRKGQHLLSEERMKSKGGLGIPQQAKIGSVSGFKKPKPNRLRSVIAQDPACL